MLPILYSFRRCPYAMRARWALLEAGLLVQWREIELRAKPPAMLEVSPKGTVPVLVLADGTVIEESLELMHWALSQADPRGCLGAGDPEPWLRENDDVFKHHLDRFKYSDRYPEADRSAHQREGLSILKGWSARIREVGWLTGDQMLERGYEDVFNWDINGDGITGEPLAVDADGDGLIDGSSIYKLLRDGAAIKLTSRGRTLSDAFSSSWDAVKAVRTQTGFKVLLEGEGQRAGQFRVWSANGRGAIFDRTPWAKGDQMLALGYEDTFNRDLNNDGIIGEPEAVDADADGLIDGSNSSIYKLFKNGQAITLTNWGRTFSDSSSEFWDAAMAVENVMGFHVLLEGEGRREDRWMVWSTDTLGAVNGWSGWATGDQMMELGYEDVFNLDFNGDGEIKQPSGAFGITGLLPGAGQFLPIVTA